MLPGRKSAAAAGLHAYVAPNEWSYDEAFSRHRGLISAAEQEKLRHSRVAIAGMGGVGGIHLITLARLGIGSFHIADPDSFEISNLNRQYGADAETLGREKVDVMARMVRAVNPDVALRVFPEAVTASNVDEFLNGVDVVVDGVDFFEIQARRLIFAEARRRGIWALTAAPIGFSTAWINFAPDGMSFDDYFDLNDSMDHLSQITAFAVGLAPRATHFRYLDLREVDLASGKGPSAGLACHLCGGVAAAETLKILLHREPPLAAPWYCQFDAYRQLFRKGRLRWGNRHPWQRFKRWLLRKRLMRKAAS